MHFEAPWLWLIVPPLAIYLVWLARRSYAQLVPAARWGSLALRCVILLSLVAALTRPAYFSGKNHHHVIFVVDASRSITRENAEAAMAEVDRLARETFDKHGDARVSVIAFGRRPSLVIRSASKWDGWPADVREQLQFETSLADLYARRTKLMTESGDEATKSREEVDKKIAGLERFRDEIAGDHTDVEAAIRLAANWGETSERKTIFLYSDGNFNHGDLTRIASNNLHASPTVVHGILLDKPLPPEAAVAGVALPTSVRVNQGFSADIHVASTVESPAKLVVYKDGFAVQESDVTLKPGANHFKTPGLYFREKGYHSVEATIRPAKDTQLKNNTSKSLVVVPGEVRVLYVDSDESQMPYLKEALELEGMAVEARPANGVPQNLSDLLSFDLYILSNVPADRLSYRQMQLVRTYVQEFGGGFIMLGGTESFGLGGYYNTPIEEILPVRMPIQKDMIRPSLAIMLVIDKSGSMSGVKIEIAKKAAIATSEAINPRDLIGLIGFDGEARVLLDLTPAADRETVTSQIGQLEAGGGTFLYPALEKAHALLAESDAQRKHVIVLSDGQTQGFGYEDLVGAMSSDGITLSAVGIGEGADMKLLEAIALAGGGRAYFTNDFYTIPQIFTREALCASNSMLVERLVQPAAVGEDVCLDEIDTESLPLISGYVATTPKSAANLILASDTGDPLLAKWRCGLGRTAAFTSDTKPRWAEDWIQWEDFAKFWSQLARSVAGEELSKSVTIECAHVVNDDVVSLTADIQDTVGNFVNDASLEATAIDSSGKALPLTVNRRAPGLYEALLPSFEFGRETQVVWRMKSAGDEASAPMTPVPYGFIYSVSPEYQTLGPDADGLSAVASGPKSKIMRLGDTALALSETAASTWIPIWPILVVIALLLAPIDILVRRLG